MRTTHIVASLGAFLVLMAAMPARAQDAEIRGERLRQTVDCRGGDALVEGNGNRLVFTGGCTGLELRGNGNSVQIDFAPRARIRLEGNGNRVSYAASANPRVTVRGEGNEVGTND